ncbi:hypothetical protein Hanom_Chr12g01094291 [Helianthus anomalus]
MDKLNQKHFLNITVFELANVYELRTHGARRFTVRVKPWQYPLVVITQHNEKDWKTKFFFLLRDSLPNG